MSYKALYRKYRPKQFNDVVGQEHIVKTLKNIIENNKVSHAYLFSGPRGTGKTSIAHIFAKNLNCKDYLNKTLYCGKCEACLSEGNIDIIEIDAASNNGVSEVRSIIENSRYAPSVSKYKVYIIDEVHMLSKGAFNALLKTLEEPPSHVIFILATTEPHKIPVTILSRTQRFNFRRITNKQIVSRLEFILEKESIEYEKESLNVISNMAKGGMRDAISIADQCASYGSSKITLDVVTDIFGILSTKQSVHLINAIAAGDTKNVLLKFNEFISAGYEVNKLTESLIEVLKEFIIYKKTNDISFIDSLTEENLKDIKVDTDKAFKILEIFTKAISDIKFSELPSQIVELSLLKAISLNEGSSNVEKIIETNIFSTSEIISKNTSSEEKDIFEKNSEAESIQQKIEKTMEFTINQEIIDNDNESSEVEEEILKQESFKTTDELNISSLFSSDETEEIETNKDKSIFSVEEIINLLIQADKNAHIQNKENWFAKNNLVSPEDRQLMHLFDKTNLISSSTDFILLESNDIHVIKEINRIRNDDKTQELITNIMGKTLGIYAITKEEFQTVKNTWINLSKTNSLPEPQPIKKPKNKIKEKSEAENLGTSLFGDIFNS